MLRRRRKTALPELPPRVISDRKSTLRRVLFDLPDPLLAALVSGLELHGDSLRCGTLFASHDASCAAGAMVRELHPDEFDCGRITFLVRHRWRKHAASYGGELRTCSHVAHIESIFDRAVTLTMMIDRDVKENPAARAVGRWIQSLAEHELERRNDLRAAGISPGIAREMVSAAMKEPLRSRADGPDGPPRDWGILPVVLPGERVREPAHA
jgi:hypothetical protein